MCSILESSALKWQRSDNMLVFTITVMKVFLALHPKLGGDKGEGRECDSITSNCPPMFVM